MSKILVLAGGSVKGAFQVGAIKAIAEQGFHPDAIYGISAGSLNAVYLVNKIGQQRLETGHVSFLQAAQDLWDFWELRISRPESLSKPFSIFQLGWSAFRKRFKGLVSTQPLRSLIEEVIELRNLRSSPVALKIGAVNVIDGGIHYVEPSEEHFIDYLMASSAVPILMPVVKINGEARRSFLDGGLRDVTPIRRALQDGATEIVCISCHPESIEGGNFDTGDLLALVDRVMDIAVNEILNADLSETILINNSLPMDGSPQPNGPFAGFQRVKITNIRPIQPLTVDLQHFNKLDIRRMMEVGYVVGKTDYN
jgi:NTE family protein